MVSFRDNILAFGNNFLKNIIAPIQVIGLVMAVGAMLFCAIKLIMAKKAEERINIIENIGFIPIGIFFIGSAMSILGYIYHGIIK
ncbi:MAG: hypothetical protein RR620_08470 [Clostridium sp.]